MTQAPEDSQRLRPGQTRSICSFEFQAYAPDLEPVWNAFVATSANGTFLFNRGFMDYHAHRFDDASMLVRRDGQLLALLPANRAGNTLSSHGGLTYGGFVTAPARHGRTAAMLELFGAWMQICMSQGVQQVIYKTIPALYHRQTAHEDRYALFRAEARLLRRDVLSVIPAGGEGLQLNALRRRSLRRLPDLQVGFSDDWAGYWQLLESVLQLRHEARPVHSLDEIKLLAGRFPEQLRLLAAHHNGRIVAGAVLFETATAVHAQYLASDLQLRSLGVLDQVIVQAVQYALDAGRHFDFGISTENGGRVLNEGLVAYKESFGARPMMHDIYEIGPQAALAALARTPAQTEGPH